MSILDRLKPITHIPDNYLSITPPVPKSCKIELTQKCNYKCQYCAITFRNGEVPKDMDWELFKRITTEMRELGVEEIGLFYIGESFTNANLLIKAIKFLKQDLKFPYVFLTSNASLAFPDIVKECMEAGLDSLKWSCNACDDTQFEKLMCVNSKSFHSALINIREAKHIRDSHNYSTKLYASSIKYNDEQQQKAQVFLDAEIKPYVDQHYWLPLYTAGGQAREKERDLGFKPIAGNTGRLDDPSEPIPCWTLFTAAHILYDGRMTACCLDGIGKWVMGDLKTQRFMGAWHSDKFQQLRKAHIDKDIRGTICERCAMYGE